MLNAAYQTTRNTGPPGLLVRRFSCRWRCHSRGCWRPFRCILRGCRFLSPLSCSRSLLTNSGSGRCCHIVGQSFRKSGVLGAVSTCKGAGNDVRSAEGWSAQTSPRWGIRESQTDPPPSFTSREVLHIPAARAHPQYNDAVARRLLTLASFLSLLVFLAIVVLWVRSYFVSDWLGRLNYSPGVPNEDHHLWIKASCGWLQVNWGGDPAANFSAVRWEVMHLSADGDYRMDEPPVRRAIGIGLERPHRLLTGETSASVRVRLAPRARLRSHDHLLRRCAARRRARLGSAHARRVATDLRHPRPLPRVRDAGFDARMISEPTRYPPTAP